MKIIISIKLKHIYSNENLTQYDIDIECNDTRFRDFHA